jgi:hypothetical protein
MMPPDVLVNGLFQKPISSPSHTILNHINCWQPSSKRYTWLDQQAQEHSQVHEAGDGMSCVSLTQRVSKTKYQTFIYYKPDEKFSDLHYSQSDPKLQMLKVN